MFLSFARHRRVSLDDELRDDERESRYLPSISINIIPLNELCLMEESFSAKSANITRFLINVLIIIHLLLFERNISSSRTLETDR